MNGPIPEKLHALKLARKWVLRLNHKYSDGLPEIKQPMMIKDDDMGKSHPIMKHQIIAEEVYVVSQFIIIS